MSQDQTGLVSSSPSARFINEIDALHGYPRSISTAEDGTIQAFESGIFQFATNIDGKEVRGEFQRVYYIPDILH